MQPTSPQPQTTGMVNNGAPLSPQQLQAYKSDMQSKGIGSVSQTSSPTASPSAPATLDWVNSLGKGSQTTSQQPSSNPITSGASDVAGGIGSLTDQTVQGTKNIQQQSANQMVNDVDQGTQDLNNETQDSSKVGLSGLGGAAKDIGGSILAGLGAGADAVKFFFAPLSATVGTAINTNANAIGSSKTVQNFSTSAPVNALFNAKQQFDNVLQQHPDVAAAWKALGDTATIAGAAVAPEAGEATAGAASDLADEATNVASDVGTMTKNALPQPKTPTVAPLNESKVLDNYNKAIKPSVTGKSNAGQIASANSRVVTGVKAIADNADNLQLSDAEGNPIKGTPKTVSQLSDAISQTKQSIFKQYNSLAKQAGDKGITVDATSIAKELDPVINDKALALTNPDAVAYAKSTQARLNGTGSLDAETAERVIKNYNDELKTFYRNPTQGAASKVQIDALIANQFRKNLDEGISGATGEQYQSLKNQYGALSSMEKDVARRSQQVAKANPNGFMSNLENIGSGIELARGLMTGNPVDVTIGAGIKGYELYQRYINNPDTRISNMFDEVNRASGGNPKATVTPQQTQQEGISSNKSNTFQPKSNTIKGITNVIKTIKDTPGKQGGYVSIGGKNVNVHPEDLATMKDFTDYVAGDYNPSEKGAQQLELDASRIAERYGIKQFKSTRGLANEFGRILDTNSKK